MMSLHSVILSSFLFCFEVFVVGGVVWGEVCLEMVSFLKLACFMTLFKCIIISNYNAWFTYESHLTK